MVTQVRNKGLKANTDQYSWCYWVAIQGDNSLNSRGELQKARGLCLTFNASQAFSSWTGFLPFEEPALVGAHGQQGLEQDGL